MGFLKSAGEGAGWLVGGVTGGIIKGVGELTGSKFIQEVGDGVKNSTEFTGKQLGNVAEGVWNLGSGLVSKDDGKVDQGFKDLGNGVANTAKAVGQGKSRRQGQDFIRSGIFFTAGTRWFWRIWRIRRIRTQTAASGKCRKAEGSGQGAS